MRLRQKLDESRTAARRLRWDEYFSDEFVRLNHRFVVSGKQIADGHLASSLLRAQTHDCIENHQRRRRVLVRVRMRQRSTNGSQRADAYRCDLSTGFCEQRKSGVYYRS